MKHGATLLLTRRDLASLHQSQRFARETSGETGISVEVVGDLETAIVRSDNSRDLHSGKEILIDW